MSDEEHSRKILAYWTEEQIRKAQPEPNPDELSDSTMAAPLSAREIRDYWTPERMAAAQPEEMAYDPHILEEEARKLGGPQVEGAGSLRIVPDETTKQFPYQSVGKLFYKKVGPSGSNDSYASAWVANISSQLHVVMTAAHCLKRGDRHAENILFIPGYIPPSTDPFGKYPQIPGGEGVAWAVDPNWNPNNLQAKYDWAIIKLDKDPSTGRYVDEVVIPIQLVLNQQYTTNSEWNTIGFPTASSQNPNGKMAERSGTFNRMSSDGGSFYKYGTLPEGTSGGPWILAGSNNSSNGIQAGNVSSYNCAQSPYFHHVTPQELFDSFNFTS